MNEQELQRKFTRLGLTPQSINGKLAVVLGKFVITFYNYYFVVNGRVPLNVADELYAIEPIGRTDIRSGGDCGCRPPATWATARNGEVIVVSPKETANMEDWAKKDSEIAKQFIKNPQYQLCHTEEEYAKYPRFVDTYHIDSELGLYLFIQILKKHALI